MLHVSSFQILSEVKTDLRDTVHVPLDTQGMVRIRCGILKNSKDMLKCNQGSCTHEISLKHLTSLPSTQLFSTRN